jgi:hypothetical protein
MPFFLIELKGALGNGGEARLQNQTACLISLKLYANLARQAKLADPENFRAPTDVMRRVYGLQSVGTGGIWTLIMMATESFDSGDYVSLSAQPGMVSYADDGIVSRAVWLCAHLFPSCLCLSIPASAPMIPRPRRLPQIRRPRYPSLFVAPSPLPFCGGWSSLDLRFAHSCRHASTWRWFGSVSSPPRRYGPAAFWTPNRFSAFFLYSARSTARHKYVPNSLGTGSTAFAQRKPRSPPHLRLR